MPASGVVHPPLPPFHPRPFRQSHPTHCRGWHEQRESPVVSRASLDENTPADLMRGWAVEFVHLRLESIAPQKAPFRETGEFSAHAELEPNPEFSFGNREGARLLPTRSPLKRAESQNAKNIGVCGRSPSKAMA